MTPRAFALALVALAPVAAIRPPTARALAVRGGAGS